MAIVYIIIDIKRDLILCFRHFFVWTNKVNWYIGVNFHMVIPLNNTQIRYVYYDHLWQTWSFCSVTTKWPKLITKCWQILGFCYDWSQNFIQTRSICHPSFLLKWFSSVTTVVITMTTQSHKFLNFWQIA